MAKGTDSIADDVRSFMNKNSIDVWTMTWKEFYALTERERIKSAFEKQLQDALKARDILLVFGRSMVAILREVNSNPHPYK